MKTAEGHAGASYRTYIVIWLSLLVGTAVTVILASVHMGRLAIMAVLVIASGKSLLVFLYFMHLRYERRRLIRLIIPIALGTLAIFIGLTYTDVLVR